MPEETSNPLDVLIIGAGFGGICMAARARRAGLTFIVLERAKKVGGTWRDNTYPGCACDTQSHHYCLSFARNPDWSRRYAAQPEILSYLEKVAEDQGVTPQVRFEEPVTGLTFDDANAQWRVTTSAGTSYSARFVVSAVGQLNEPAIPDFPGLSDFAGKIMHTAQWDHAYDFAGKAVAVIGSGASAIQLVPPVAEQAAHVTVFQRSPHWLVTKGDRPFKPWEKTLFRYLPPWAWLYRAWIYWSWELSWPQFLEGSRQAVKQTHEVVAGLRRSIADPELVEQVIPADPLGCKRILLTDNYFSALQRKDVELNTDGIDRIIRTGIVSAAGTHVPADCIVMATGFKSHDFLPGMTVIGRDGRNLHQEWAASGGAEAYLGIVTPGFPNLFFLYGPNTNLGHNSIVFMIECQANYVIDAIQTVRRQRAVQIEVTDAAKAEFDAQLERELAKTAWAGSCTSWYKTGRGKIVNNWSSNTVKYWLRTRRLRRHRFTISN